MKKLYTEHKAVFITVAVIIFILIMVGIVLLIQWWQSSQDTTRGKGTPKGDENNPLNLRETSTKWLGEIDIGTPTQFTNFKTPADGYRAAFITLYNYVKHGENTIRKIITKFAPPEDGNDTEAYIKNVSKAIGIDPDTHLTTDLFLGHKGVELVTAMAKQEQGKSPNMTDLYSGYYLFTSNYLA